MNTEEATTSAWYDRLSVRILIVLLVGVSMRLVSPPTGLSAIHWFNLVPAFWVLKPGENRRNAWLMYVMGVALIGSNYSWVSVSIINFSNVPVPVAWLVVALYAVAFALPFALLGAAVHWTKQRFGVGWIWLLPGLQVAIEHAWPALFPYYHGALFYRTEWTWQWASVFGVTGLTYLVFLTTCLGTELLWRFGPQKQSQPAGGFTPLRKTIIAVAGLFAGHLIFGAWRFSAVENSLQSAERLKVAILQQNVTMQYRLQRSPWVSIRDWTKQTLSVVDQKPDLVIWPEGALGGPVNPNDTKPMRALGNRSLKDVFAQLAKKHNFAFLVGGGTVNFHNELDKDGYPKYTAYNSCYLFDRSGEITGRYDKMIPLPFGEYIPFSETFPILNELIQGPGNFKAGKEVTYFEADTENFEYSFSTPICYEAILERQMRQMADSDLFINITNDAWFGDTQAPHQHAMLSTVQAIQYGRPLLRIAYTGVSFLVEPHGRIRYETHPFEEVAKVEELRMGQINTIYRQGGWLFPWAWLGAWIPLFLFNRKRQETPQEKPTPQPNEERTP